MIDHEHLYRFFPALEFESKLLLKSRGYVGARITIRIPLAKAESDPIDSFQAGPVQNGPPRFVTPSAWASCCMDHPVSCRSNICMGTPLIVKPGPFSSSVALFIFGPFFATTSAYTGTSRDSRWTTSLNLSANSARTISLH